VRLWEEGKLRADIRDPVSQDNIWAFVLLRFPAGSVYPWSLDSNLAWMLSQESLWLEAHKLLADIQGLLTQDNIWVSG